MNATDDYRLNYICNNAERLLELKLLGWAYRKLEPVQSPFNVEKAVDDVIAAFTPKIRPGQFKCPKPIEPYGPEIVLAMRQLNGIYGELYRHLTAKWATFANYKP